MTYGNNKISFKSSPQHSGFTLVELIVVITILLILTTFGFLYFRDYLKTARDAKRVSVISNLTKGLENFHTKSGNYPKPDEHFSIQADGELLGYQGLIGESIAGILQIKKPPTDPSLDELYMYSTNPNQTKFQILGYFENQQ